MKRTLTLPLTLQEAHTVLRALATANDSERTPKPDHQPNTWVASRLLALIEQGEIA